jgi:hypothetical protein
MSNTLLDVRAVLESAGYRAQIPNPTAQHLYFEDSNILGIAYVLESVAAIIEQWEKLQDQFLRENAHRLLFDPLKAWNCYTVLLTSEQAAKEAASTLFMIEEDFRGTRKIVRTGMTTRTEMEESLAPLLPLRRILSLAPDDVRSRLTSRLGEPDNPLRALLTDTHPSASNPPDPTCPDRFS